MSLEVGRIVLVPADDGHGNIKARPVVIVSLPAEHDQDQSILGVCVSTQIERPIPDHHVELPWQRPRHPKTGLDRPNVAKCHWPTSFHPDDIVRELGIVPARQMLLISEALKRLSDAQGS